MTNRPRPVLILTMIGAGLAAITGFSGLAELIPELAVKWLLLIEGAYIAVTGVYLQRVVTPAADPRDDQGRKLVPENEE